MSETHLETPRLHLRPVTPQDSGLITEIVGDPRVHRMLARVPPGQTKAQTLAWIMTHERGRETDTDHVFAITEGGGLIGVIGANRAATDLPFEIGYWLAPPAWGKGFCSEAGAAVIRWLEATRNARALVAGHFADNPASGRVLSKLGFLPCGRDKMHCAGRGERVDHIRMARIA
jgi:[ribosomal protein S5]-alanine N-acetyltransferase